MIILLHGPDSFRSRVKLNLMVASFKKQRDPRGDNVVQIDGVKTTLDEINSKVASRSLLAEKRLLIIEDLFNHANITIFKSVLEYLRKFEEEKNENTLIFYEARELDSKKYGEKKLLADQKKLLQFLTEQKFSEKFNLLDKAKIISWIQRQAKELDIAINLPAADSLATALGGDLWTINNELNKLIGFVKARGESEIFTEDIRQLTRGKIDDNIFALTDAISNKNKARFFSLLEEQLEAGASIQQILTMLTRQFKIILQIKELLFQKTSPANIASELKLHPFVVQKTTPQTRNFSLDYLKNILHQLVEIDYKIKTGQADGLTSLNLLFAK